MSTSRTVLPSCLTGDRCHWLFTFNCICRIAGRQVLIALQPCFLEQKMWYCQNVAAVRLDELGNLWSLLTLVKVEEQFQTFQIRRPIRVALSLFKVYASLIQHHEPNVAHTLFPFVVFFFIVPCNLFLVSTSVFSLKAFN